MISRRRYRMKVIKGTGGLTVDPSDVEEQKQLCGQDLRLCAFIRMVSGEKLQEWKKALRKAATLLGWHSENG
ncbi:hypothetical protein OIU74_024193, partial [Salix koriyanagi]